MELLLNIVWLSVSCVLIILCVRSIGRGHTKLSWNTAVALFVLLVLLFPVISMTDDLQAITAPAEVEHLMRRHLDAPLLPMGAMLDTVALLSLLILGFALPKICSVRVRTHKYGSALLAGFVRAFGVRPPPVAVLLMA